MYGQKSISQSLLDAVNSVTHAEVEEGFKELMQDVKDRAGPQPNGGAGIKQGTRYGGGRQKDDEREKETERLEKKKEVKKESFRDFKDRLIESLKGNQKKIDKNHNNKLDAQDFKILRGEKKANEEVKDEYARKVDKYLKKKYNKEEVELDEAGEPTPKGGLTVDTLAGPKKAPKGFEKDNEHTSAKVPLKTEAYTSKELKMAGGIAKDKRYAGGNMTGASNVMDKIKPGLSQTKQAQKALRQANEESEGHEDEKEDKALMKKMIKKSALKNEETLEERDEGKPGLMFKKIAAKASSEYGSKEAGNRVAGAIRKKVLAKEGKRPESDTVPFVTDASQSPKERLRAALGKVKKEMSNGY